MHTVSNIALYFAICMKNGDAYKMQLYIRTWSDSAMSYL